MSKSHQRLSTAQWIAILVSSAASIAFALFAVGKHPGNHAVIAHVGGWTLYVRTIVDLEVYRAGSHVFYSHFPFVSGASGHDVFTTGLYSRWFSTSEVDLPFTYPPFAAAALGWMIIFPFTVTSVIQSIASVAALIAVTFIIGRSWKTSTRTLAAVAVVWAEPVRATLSFGQINCLLLFMVVLDWWIIDRLHTHLHRESATAQNRSGNMRSRGFSGILTGIAAAIKLTPAVFILYPLFRKDWAAGVRMAITGIACCILAAIIHPGDTWQYFSTTLWETNRIGQSSLITNQSWKGALSRLDSCNLDVTRAGCSLTFHHLPTGTLWLILVLATLAASYVISRKSAAHYENHYTSTAVSTPSSGQITMPVGAAITFSTLALVQLLCSPISWSHHWVWAIPAIYTFLTWGNKARVLGWLGVVFLWGAAVSWSGVVGMILHNNWTRWVFTLTDNIYLLWAGLAIFTLTFVPWKILFKPSPQ